MGPAIGKRQEDNSQPWTSHLKWILGKHRFVKKGGISQPDIGRGSQLIHSERQKHSERHALCEDKEHRNRSGLMLRV
jgi:hypothetical protein